MSDETRFGGCDCTPKADGEVPGATATPEGPSEKPSFEASCKAGIKIHCEAVCAEKEAADRGPCEVTCMREPLASFDGKLKECTPDLAGY